MWIKRDTISAMAGTLDDPKWYKVTKNGRQINGILNCLPAQLSFKCGEWHRNRSRLRDNRCSTINGPPIHSNTIPEYEAVVQRFPTNAINTSLPLFYAELTANTSPITRKCWKS